MSHGYGGNAHEFTRLARCPAASAPLAPRLETSDGTSADLALINCKATDWGNLSSAACWGCSERSLAVLWM